ncbi:hypothetical protein SLS61_001053 [Didymella pomorum]
MSSSTPSRSWFDRYPDFTPNKTGLWNNFCRLSKKRKWGSEKKGEMLIQCLIAEFNNKVASQADVSRLEKWQELCRDVYIKNPPGSVKQSKKILGARKMLVNVINLIDHRVNGTPVIRFKNYDECHEYTDQPGRRFPIEAAKQEGFIKSLLREL